jgi:hypothetical protein
VTPTKAELAAHQQRMDAPLEHPQALAGENPGVDVPGPGVPHANQQASHARWS